MHNYKSYINQKQIDYPNKFDDSDLAEQFIPFYENQQRIEVDFYYKGKVTETKRGRIGITTGWKPCFLLMLTVRSIGSMYTLGKDDKIVKIIK